MYPENVAYPIGGEQNDRYLMIEIHYDNPGMESGSYIIAYSNSSILVMHWYQY